MEKKSFVLYSDQKEIIDELDDEQAGKLFKAIYEYNTIGKISLTGMLKSVFMSFKIAFDRDELKWSDIREKRSKAGKKGMESRWSKEDKNITNDNKRYQNLTDITVSGSVSVSDSVSVSGGGGIDINSESIVEPVSPTHTPSLLDIQSFCANNDMSEFDCEYFFNHYEANGWTNPNGTKIRNWQAKVKTWYSDDLKKGKIKRKPKYDTRRINEDEDGRLFQYDEGGNKIYVDNL